MHTNTMKYGSLAPQDSFERAAKHLQENGFDAFIVTDVAAAKRKLLEMIPQGAEVMNMTSVTLDTASIAKEVNESGKFNSVRAKLAAMDRNTQGVEMQKLGGAPEWVVGSVHAITEDGEAMIASNTGSQLGAYAYGSRRVIWVVGGQKIVKDLEEGFARIYEHSLPLESERAKKAYGIQGSSVNKVLIVNKEVQPGRITVLLVKEVIGF